VLSKSQFQLLSHLIGEAGQEVSISTLAEQLEWSPGHTSRIIAALETNGYVRTSDVGREKRVTAAEIEPIEQLKSLVTEYRHVDFADVVAGAGFEVLYYLDEGRTATEIAERSSVSRATVYRRLDELQTVGIVGKSESRYQLNDSFTDLSSIARGLAHHKHRREAERHTSGVSILWETHAESLFACDDEINADDFHLTGPSLFAEFDIPLLSRTRRHYFHSDRISKVSAPDLVCHMLLISDEPRYRTYCLLVIAGEDLDRDVLHEHAEQYALEADTDLLQILDRLVQYLDTEGDSTSKQLPSWTEFKSTAADYDITV
jgi:DNA-binding MarR family transcriptional regulator